MPHACNHANDYYSSYTVSYIGCTGWEYNFSVILPGGLGGSSCMLGTAYNAACSNTGGQSLPDVPLWPWELQSNDEVPQKSWKPEVLICGWQNNPHWPQVRQRTMHSCTSRYHYEMFCHCNQYCQRSGSGPPWLMGHFAFFCWMKGHKNKVSRYKGASIGHIYGLKSSSGGMWWSSLKMCPIIKNCPKMAVFLFCVTHKFQMLLGRTRQL